VNNDKKISVVYITIWHLTKLTIFILYHVMHSIEDGTTILCAMII